MQLKSGAECMVPFAYSRAADLQTAVATGARHRSDEASTCGVDFFAGGTDMMQLMRESVRNPGHIVDISTLPHLSRIESNANGLHLGALARMSDAAAHPDVRAHYPVIAEALLASASPQVRNLATLGGNLLQRTRCGYFRDVVTPCNKREPGSGCPALNGQNRLHAILGTSDHCIATYAGDFANALVVLDAKIHVLGRTARGSCRSQNCIVFPKEPHTSRHSLSPGNLSWYRCSGKHGRRSFSLCESAKPRHLRMVHCFRRGRTGVGFLRYRQGRAHCCGRRSDGALAFVGSRSNPQREEARSPDLRTRRKRCRRRCGYSRAEPV